MCRQPRPIMVVTDVPRPSAPMARSSPQVETSTNTLFTDAKTGARPHQWHGAVHQAQQEHNRKDRRRHMRFALLARDKLVVGAAGLEAGGNRASNLGWRIHYADTSRFERLAF